MQVSICALPTMVKMLRSCTMKVLSYPLIPYVVTVQGIWQAGIIRHFSTQVTNLLRGQLRLFIAAILNVELSKAPANTKCLIEECASVFITVAIIQRFCAGQSRLTGLYLVWIGVGLRNASISSKVDW